MDKMILNNGSQIEIRNGASLSTITTELDSYSDITKLALKLTPANLSKVQFVQETEKTSEVIAEYTDMLLLNDQLIVSICEEKVVVKFGIHETR